MICAITLAKPRRYRAAGWSNEEAKLTILFWAEATARERRMRDGRGVRT